MVAGPVGPVSIDQSSPGVTNLVQTPIPASVITGQVIILVTNTAVQLPSHALVNGIVVKAKSTNAAQSTTSGMVGPVGVTNVFDGTGNGYPLAPGEAMSVAIPNTNLVYVNGTAGDVFSFGGN